MEENLEDQPQKDQSEYKPFPNYQTVLLYPIICIIFFTGLIYLLFTRNYTSLTQYYTSKPNHSHTNTSNFDQESFSDKRNLKSENLDFGPYMRGLQRRIKRNWDPPKGDESKRIILLFKLNKDGSLVNNIKIIKSSENAKADEAAIQAVKLSDPFEPLPAAYTGKDIDIQFTFDYNVWPMNERKFSKD